MELKQNARQTPESPQLLVMQFSLDETDILRAVYREKIHNLVKNRESAKIKEAHFIIAQTPIGEIVSLFADDTDTTASDLEEFSVNTPTALFQIAHLNTIPAHEDSFIYDRSALGGKAMELAIKLRELGDEFQIVENWAYGEAFVEQAPS